MGINQRRIDVNTSDMNRKVFNSQWNVLPNRSSYPWSGPSRPQDSMPGWRINPEREHYVGM